MPKSKRGHRIIGNFDARTPAPRIPRVRRGEERPLWSVMIPTYNDDDHLDETLKSVLAQDPGLGAMQIEVVDDSSTRGNPEAVVQETGKGRVGFFRKQKNEGATANFNTCLERSRGRLVHILHGDDMVDRGFYSRIQTAADRHRRIAAFFARCRIIDADGTLDRLAPRLRTLSLPTRAVGELLQVNQLFTPGAVVRRSFYEKHGGFLPELVHCADWEMWVRAISRGGGLWINEPLASYRFFPGNDTTRHVRTGENIRDHLRVASIFSGTFPDFDFELCERTLARQALRQMQRFEESGDSQAAAANKRLYFDLAPPSRRRFLAAWDREIGIVQPRR